MMADEFASSPCMLHEFGGAAPIVTAAMAQDAAEIAAVLVASIRDLCVADHGGAPDAIAGWTANKTADQVRAWIADADQDVLVSREVADGPIACVGAVDATWILLDYVAPAFRGRGHSTAMLSALERHMAARGTRTGRLMSSQTAHAFYRARGWHDAGTGPCVGAGTLRGHLMTKEVAR